MIQVQEPLGLKDNYNEQMRRLEAMCGDGIAETEVAICLRFAYTGSKAPRRRTLEMRDRVAAALEALGLTYTLLLDPDSTFRDPVYVLILKAPTWQILEFYQAIDPTP